ncbi:S-formylglutathione hydrolase [Parasphingorhabdus marina DSM 22363]|uniref:S-formylglutathione hydrolase n=1 Tax=Parasphingorhabdus marina DSM 22363 TaxID=1123272 RepID=A0A1N6DA03_9SPHN|nr:S-formylglutathione hydrolase [Parasphingorhabdus marina]SIN67524.1 S-formylglutathione hydrolase [Parasphingorhabdus marina DSM 22363]
METISANKSHHGTQYVCSHPSIATKTEMLFSVFVPHGDGPFPVLWYLSGLTCSHANVTEKGEYRKACAEHGIIFVAPDTSPRGESVANGETYSMGQGASFYIDATQAPWKEHFQMKSYVENELPELVAREFLMADTSRQGITGHSMGGHGALMIGLRNPGKFRSISAFAPITSPMNCPWGEAALSSYLGGDQAAWAEYDSCELIKKGATPDALLIDQGLADEFLSEQLKPNLLEEACKDTNINLRLRRHEGYDHSYYFISTFLTDHIEWHSKRLLAQS